MRKAQQRCPKCRLAVPAVRFYTGTATKVPYCMECWKAYLLDRYAAQRQAKGLAYRVRGNKSAARDLAACMAGWR